MELVKNLLRTIDEETDNSYGFFVTVSMNLLLPITMLDYPMIVKTAPQLEWMNALHLRYYAGAKVKKNAGYKKINPTEKLMSDLRPV